jgi:hypothetical protein
MQRSRRKKGLQQTKAMTRTRAVIFAVRNSSRYCKTKVIVITDNMIGVITNSV